MSLPLRKKHFGGLSENGLNISLINFTVPHSPSVVHGVSLVFTQDNTESCQKLRHNIETLSEKLELTDAGVTSHFGIPQQSYFSIQENGKCSGDVGIKGQRSCVDI